MYVLRLRKGGLLWMAPVCSSFVFANSANTKRTSENVIGDETYEPVLLGNLMARAAAFLMAVAAARGVEAAIENPASSMIFRYPPMHTVLHGLNARVALTDCCPFSTIKFGQRFLKQFKIAATGTWITRMVRKCRCPGGLHVQLMSTSPSGAVSGTKALKQSQAYPPKFGQAVIEAWLAGEEDSVPQPRVKSAKSANSTPKAEVPSVTGPEGPSWTRPIEGTPERKRPAPSVDPNPAKKQAGATWQKPKFF
jgi:hypothetical protein